MFRKLILRLTHRMWNREISRILCNAHEVRLIDSRQLHELTARFDPTQKHSRTIYDRSFAFKSVPFLIVILSLWSSSTAYAEGVIGSNKLDRETADAVQREYDARKSPPLAADDYDPFPSHNVRIQSIRPRKPTAIVQAPKLWDYKNGKPDIDDRWFQDGYGNLLVLPREKAVPAAKKSPTTRRRITIEFSIYLD